MRKLRVIICNTIIVTSSLNAAVVTHALPQSLEIFNTATPGFVFTPFDVDGNGTMDFSFAAFFTEVALRTERSNRLVINVSPPPDLGGPVASLNSTFVIGPSLLDSNVRWTSSDILGGYVSQDEFEFSSIIQVYFSGSSTQFTERSAIGIEFEAEDGIHYGYFDISPFSRIAPRIILHGWAWETEPGKAILAGQVPEPSSLLLLASGACIALSRRRRNP